MKKMKRLVAATLAMTVLFATTVMAQTPREILSQAYANSADATVMSMTGNIAGTVFMEGVELFRLNMDMHIDMDIDLDAGTMMMYMRMPMQISGTDPITGESLNENIVVAMFMDDTRVFVYESTIGWFTDPSLDMSDMGDIFGLMGDMDGMMSWFLDINEQIMDEITIEFADDQVPGFYVIEQFMDFDDMMNMLNMFLTPEFFEELFAFMPEADLGELDFVMAELDDAMDELMALLEEIDINMEAVYRSYIDAETLHFSTYEMVMTLDFAANLDLGILGQVDISGNFTMDFVVDYDPAIVWPVIESYVYLADILGDLGIYHAELIFEEADLENRVAMVFDDVTTVLVEIAIDAVAAFNLFFVNHGNEAVVLIFDGITVDTVVQPGQDFVRQLPAGETYVFVVIASTDGGPINVEAGFRLTNYPLGSE